jgi:lipopolysaccharide/colanic/teichoic acid biosynthesis glycosyltransferase
MNSRDRRRRSQGIRGRALLAKRATDLSMILLFSPIWVPLLAMVLLAAQLFQGRPILFSQSRMGFRGRRFRIWKVRTMSAENAPDADRLFEGWTYRNDPRITPFGAILRRFRLDELPQLWNVIRGDMSLVGPRPEPWDVAKSLSKAIPGYRFRHLLPPGLTGPCQLSATYYDFGSIEKATVKVEFDHYYLRNWSWAYDLRLLARTIPALFRHPGIQ